MTDDTFETPTPADEAIEQAPDALEATESSADQPAEDGAESSAGEATAAEARPREVIKGIHPELRCEDPECGPEFTELQFFSPEEAVKVKGKTMLFCARSGKKYFAPAPELQTWLAENKVKTTGRGRRDG